jgi:hypothetical protein
MMSQILERIRELLREGKVRISVHGYDELANDKLTVDEIMAGVVGAAVVEDYPDFGRGPAVLVLQRDSVDAPVHVVWGIAKGTIEPAVLVTAYRPDLQRWSEDFLRRKQ